MANSTNKSSLPIFPNGKAGIYAIINKTNGKTYYGSSANLASRKRTHWSNLKKGTNSPYMQNEYNKFGHKVFEFVILEHTKPDKETLLRVEQKYLDKYYDNQNQCYNISPKASSRLGSKDSAETKKKKSLIFSGTGNPMHGKKHSDETKIKISKSNTGKKHPNCAKGKQHHWYGAKHSEETKKRMSDVAKLRWKNLEYKNNMKEAMRHAEHASFLGKKHSTETKKHMSKIKMGSKNPMFGKFLSERHKKKISAFRSKKVEQLDAKTGQVLNVFTSATEAEKQTGANAGTVSKVCLNQKYRKTAGGFSWRYRS